MTKLSLPQVTLFCADCVNADRAIASIERCKSVCDFGDVKFLTSLPTDYPHVRIAPLETLVHYSIFMLKDSFAFVETSHYLVVQHDSWIINPDSWDERWLELGYIAPLFVQYPVVGSGGFSLRSRRLMESVSLRTPPWNGTREDAERIQPCIGAYEDGAIAMGLRDHLEGEGFQFGTLAQASKFAQGGNQDTAYHFSKPFGFHREGAEGLISPLLP